MPYPSLPPTPSELLELHGIDPVGTGDSGEFAQIWLKATGTANSPVITTDPSSTPSVSISPSLVQRRIYTYLYQTSKDASAHYANFEADLLFTRGGSIVARFPLNTAIPSGGTGGGNYPADFPEQYVRIGTHSPVEALAQDVICAIWMNPLMAEQYFSFMSPVYLSTGASVMKLVFKRSFNCDFRLWVGCLSTGG